MASSQKNLSDTGVIAPVDENCKIGLVVAEWNEEITGALYQGAVQTLINNGIRPEHLFTKEVPGAFELPYGALCLIQKECVDAVIAIGCIIRGDTPHFDYISQGVTYGLMKVGLENAIPAIFGVLTTDTQQQALDRCGGKHGNKGDEAAATALKLLRL